MITVKRDHTSLQEKEIDKCGEGLKVRYTTCRVMTICTAIIIGLASQILRYGVLACHLVSMHQALGAFCAIPIIISLQIITIIMNLHALVLFDIIIIQPRGEFSDGRPTALMRVKA